MIENARVLQPEFIPGEIKHRDAETSHLSDALNPLLHGEAGETSFLFGPSGAGKTCVAKFTVNQLQENTVDVESQYVNCWENYSRFRTLYQLLDGIGKTIDIHRQSTPTDVLLERIRDYDDSQYVVILDEVDQLEDKSLLYDLYRIPNLTMILIANREESLFAPLDDRLHSRLSSSERLHFGQYRVDELTAILADRVQWGLATNAVERRQIELIADAAAGDARKAIGILRTAAKKADREGLTEITAEIIDESVPEAKSELRQKNIENLTSHQQSLFEIIANAGEINGKTLYERYCETVSSPKTKRTMRNYLSKMEHYNLIAATGKTQGKTYKSVGEAAESTAKPR